MTLGQLRTAQNVGAVAGVRLKALGGAFLVEIATRTGSVILAKARGSEPRRFGNPTVALNVLREIGITAGQFDTSEWDPEQKETTAGGRGRGEVLRKAHEAAAYNEWLAAEIQEVIDDPRPSVPHDEVLAEMDAELPLEAKHKAIPRRAR